jgi:hypothetical protein
VKHLSHSHRRRSPFGSFKEGFPRVKQAFSIYPENDKDPIESIALKFGKLKGHGFDAMALDLI